MNIFKELVLEQKGQEENGQVDKTEIFVDSRKAC
jgi:hypothetical protein